MASQFPAFIPHAQVIEEPRVHEEVFLSTDTSQPGDFVFFDTADNNVKICGANPALILGLSLGNAPASTLIGVNAGKPVPYAPNKSPVAVLTADVVVGLSSTTTPTRAFLFNHGPYGITLVTAGGRDFWQLDTSKTGANGRAIVIDVDIPNGIWYCRFLPANLQGQSVVS